MGAMVPTLPLSRRSSLFPLSLHVYGEILLRKNRMIQEESDDSPLITLASGSLSVHVRQPLCQKDTHATHPSDAKIHHGSGSETLLQSFDFREKKNSRARQYAHLMLKSRSTHLCLRTYSPKIL